MTVHSAHVVVGTDRFDADLDVLLGRLGFRVDAIHPADAPSTATVSGHGVRIRLVRSESPTPVTIELVVDEPGDPIELPGGSTVESTGFTRPIELPDNRPSLTVTRAGGPSAAGRAGMRYRDLLPDRWGGRFIASHITIPDGGPVPDYVHFHRIRFQLIFVKAGWVRVAYEDQGDAFVMHAGDAVLQPPEIRHRVLESSPGLEVIEVGCPAEHETLADRSLELPTPSGDPHRRWDGQRFVRHVAAGASWRRWRTPGWECRDTGIADATGGIAGVSIARPLADVPAGVGFGPLAPHEREFVFHAVLAGSVTAELAGRAAIELAAGDTIAVPPDLPYRLAAASPDCELLDVTLPA